MRLDACSCLWGLHHVAANICPFSAYTREPDMTVTIKSAEEIEKMRVAGRLA
ncbi:MAG: type I methionyl aminopeptidase, partial [Ectopseudomonas oleovorans]